MLITVKKCGTGLMLFFGLIFYSCKTQSGKTISSNYIPDSRDLYDSIVHMDTVLFTAYNTCDMETFASCFSDNIEFYHDQGGLMTNKDSILAATKRNICGKVTRVLIEGSIEVYAIKGYGAIEMGLHYFINNREPKPDHPSIGKFVHTWKKDNPRGQGGGKWILTRVISLH